MLQTRTEQNTRSFFSSLNMILVTGGTGFLGSELTRQLIAQGKKVRLLYRSEDRRLQVGLSGDQVEWAEGDILDICSLDKAMEGVQEVYHCAAFIGYEWGSYRKLMQVNVTGTANIVNAMLHAGARKLIFAGSVTALGGKPGEMIQEDTKWENSTYTTRYALSKLLAEREVFRGKEEGLEVVVVEPGVIVGPGFWEETVMGTIFRSIDKGFPFYMSGSKGYVDVRDVASVMIRLMNSDISGERFLLVADNLGYKDLFAQIATALNKKVPSVYLPAMVAFGIAVADSVISLLSGRRRKLTFENLRVSLQPFQYDSSLVEQRLGVKWIPIRESIRHMAEAYREAYPAS